MKQKAIILTSIFFAVSIIFFATSFTTNQKKSVNGVWKICEVQTVKANGNYTTIYPTESMAIFTNGYYSFCWAANSIAPNTWQLTDSVKLLRFNQSIVNTGIYTFKEAVLTTKANFAMNPMFVNGEAKFKCTFSGDTLILNGLSVMSLNGIPNPAYANGLHFISKLVKIK